MKTCNNCLYCDNCSAEDKSNGRCEYYDPLIGAENIAKRQYEQDLKARAEEYLVIVTEQQD